MLERLRFLAITASNLDEFFEVRVAGLQAQLYDHLEPQDPPPDGMSPLAQLVEIGRRVREFVARQYETLRTTSCRSWPRPASSSPGERTEREENAFLDGYFESEVYPVLTPLAIDPAHPFPHLHNKSLNLILRLERSRRSGPRPGLGSSTPSCRSPQCSAGWSAYRRKGTGRTGSSCWKTLSAPGSTRCSAASASSVYAPFRVTRNSDLSIQESDVRASLLSIIQENLRKRMWGDAVRMEISDRADEAFVSLLKICPALDLEDRRVLPRAGAGCALGRPRSARSRITES